MILFLWSILFVMLYGIAQGLTEAFVWNSISQQHLIKDVRMYHLFRAVELLSVLIGDLLLLLIFYDIECLQFSFIVKALLFIVGRHFIFQVVYRVAFVLERGQSFHLLSRPTHWEVGSFNVPYPSKLAYAIGIPVGALMMWLAIGV